MKLKNTPGPWRVAGKHSNGAVVIRGEEVSSEIAIVLQNDSRYSAEDNAQLLAAAPDLLVALNGLLERFETMIPNSSHYDEYTDAYAAIAKAHGGDI